ncbi:hypothetical protein GW17_00052723, partial [Ensete ventricosum]
SSVTAVCIATPSSSYCSCTLVATDAIYSHEVVAQSQSMLLLPSSSSTVAATLGCHPPLETSPPQDKLFLKCHIQLNQLWFLMQCSLISGYFHDFTEERTMMLKVFPDDDLRSTTHDRMKE